MIGCGGGADIPRRGIKAPGTPIKEPIASGVTLCSRRNAFEVDL
jgi:hypothetical protein